MPADGAEKSSGRNDGDSSENDGAKDRRDDNGSKSNNGGENGGAGKVNPKFRGKTRGLFDNSASNENAGPNDELPKSGKKVAGKSGEKAEIGKLHAGTNGKRSGKNGKENRDKTINIFFNFVVRLKFVDRGILTGINFYFVLCVFYMVNFMGFFCNVMDK